MNKEERAMKLLMTTVVLVAALALTGNAAMAAAAPNHKVATAKHVAHAVTHVTHAAPHHRRPAAHVAHYRYRPSNRLGFDVGQFIQGMLGGGPVPYANLVRDVERMHGVRGGGGSYAESPTYDNSAPVSSFNDAQAAADAAAENNAITEMNDTNALTASMAAAEEQNDAANAATLQTEINAGM
jgi:hypothetical protein